MDDTSESVKNTMEATCSDKIDTSSVNNVSMSEENSVLKGAESKETSLTSSAENKQDPESCDKKCDLNESIDCSDQSSHDNGLDVTTSSDTSLNTETAALENESSEETSASNKSDTVKIVNGEDQVQKEDTEQIKNTRESSNHEQGVSEVQNISGITSETKNIDGKLSDELDRKSITETGNSLDKQAEETVTSEIVKKISDENEKEESSEEKNDSSNDSKVSTGNKGKRAPRTSISRKREVTEDESDGSEAKIPTSEILKRPGDDAESSSKDSKEDQPKTSSTKKQTNSSKKKSTKTKATFHKTPVVNESGRSTRSSNNPDFAAKQRSFLNKVQNAYSSIKLLDAASSMSESDGEGEGSDSSYSETGFGDKTVSSAEKKFPLQIADRKMVSLPPGLAEKLAEKSRALLSEKKLVPVPFPIGDKKLAPTFSAEKKLVAVPAVLPKKVSVNGVSRKSDDLSNPLPSGTKLVHELDEEQTLLIPTSSKNDAAISRKRKASSAELTEGDSEDNSSPAKTPGMPHKKAKIIRVDETGKESTASCDVYCWFCHREGISLICKTCPRVYHLRCLSSPPPEHAPGKWVCPLCVTILKAESTETRSRAMKMLTLDQFCLLLSFTVSRMKAYSGSDVFSKPVDPKEFPMYSFYIVHPMDISQLERNIKNRIYGSTEAFLADVSWILHNCAIFNSLNNKLTHMAKQMVKICRQEIADIENCPDCYLHAHSGNVDWFLEVCRRPHLLVWAKLKGFPFWPAKAMLCSSDGMVDVRFFGAHDRAWVPAKECLLYTRAGPLSKKKKKNTLDSCIEELEKHVTKLEACFGEYVPADGRVPLDPKKLDEQLMSTLPAYNYAEAMKLPVAFANPSLVKSCEENMKVFTQINFGQTHELDDASLVTDEDADITHSDSFQSDKEEMPTKAVKRARVSTQKVTPKNAGKNVASAKGVGKRETRKSGIVDRLSEKLALLEDDHSNTPPPVPTEPNPVDEPMDTEIPTNQEPPSLTTDGKSGPIETSPVKVEPPSESPNPDPVSSEKPTAFGDTETAAIITEIKLEREDSSDSLDRPAKRPVLVSVAPIESIATPVSNLSEVSKTKPVVKRRSMRSAAAEAAAKTKPTAEAKTKASPAAKTAKTAHAKSTSPDAGKKGGKSKGLQISPKKKGQEEGSKNETPKKVVGVIMASSPQEKFTARKSVPGGNVPKNLSLIKTSHCPLPPSMSASPTIVSSIRLQTSAPSQPIQVISTPGLPSLTVAPIARNTSLLTTSVKTSIVSSMPSSSSIVSTSLASGGSLLLTSLSSSSGSTTTPTVSNTTVSSPVVAEPSPNMPALSSAPTSAKSSTVTTSSPLAAVSPTYAPSTAGPHAAGIRSHAAKLTEFFCGVIEETIKDIGGKGNASATIKALQLEFERLNWQHAQEMTELRHNTSLVVEEIKKTFETEKLLAIKDAVAARTTIALKEKEAAIIATKRKQWCAFCLKEALFYCCWNTSYCDYSCQQKHWPVHSMYCTQNENCDESSPNIASGGPKNVFIKAPISSNGATTTTTASANSPVTGTLMPVISARSSVSISGDSTTPTYVLAVSTISSPTTSGSAIFVSSRPSGSATTTVTNARPYVLPQNVRIRPSAPGQKVLLRPGGKVNPQQNPVVFVVNNQKAKN